MGFAILGYKDNGISSFVTHGIGTPKLQMGNILKKPIIWLPNLIVAGILGPISTLVFKHGNQFYRCRNGKQWTRGANCHH